MLCGSRECEWGLREVLERWVKYLGEGSWRTWKRARRCAGVPGVGWAQGKRIAEGWWSTKEPVTLHNFQAISVPVPGLKLELGVREKGGK